MKKVEEYLDNLSILEYLNAYQEYKTAKRTGVYPQGHIRTIAKLIKEITGNLDLHFAERLLLERFADQWYRQNKS